MTKLSTLPLPSATAKEQGFCENRLASISNLMQDSVDRGAIPGAAVVLARNGKVVLADSFGYQDVESKKPLALDSLFRMYSQTKPIVAALTMRLFEQGKIFLNQPISDILPEFSNLTVDSSEQFSAIDQVRGSFVAPGNLQVPVNRAITVTDLLTMVSGISTGANKVPAMYGELVRSIWTGSGFIPGDTRMNDPLGTYEEMVLAVAHLPLQAQPGEKWNYGSEYDVLALILERVSGKPMNELIRTELMEPMGRVDTNFYCSEDNKDRLTTEYMWDEEGGIAVREKPEDAEKASLPSRKLMSGSGLYGGLLSTPGDYLQFAQMLLDGGSIGDRQVLGRKTIELMTTDHTPSSEVDVFKMPGYGFGFGHAVRRSMARSHIPGSVGEFGWGGYGGTSFFVDPSENMVGLFFTHVFGYQANPTADIYEQFQSRAYQALI